MNPGTSGSMKIKEEPLDHATPQEQHFPCQETKEHFEFNNIKVEQQYTEQNSPYNETIVEGKAEVLKQNDKPMMLISTSGEQRTSMEMNPDPLGITKIKEELLDHTIFQEQHLSCQKTRDVIKFETIKVESYYPEPSCPPHELNIKEEPEDSKALENPIKLLSASGERRTAIKLELKVDSDDLGTWENEPIDSSSGKTGCAGRRKTFDQKKIGQIFQTPADSPARTMLYSTEELYKNSDCKKVLSLDINAKEQIKIHTDEMTYNCSACEKTFTHKEKYKRHMKIHTREKQHECSVCKQAFMHKDRMKKHMLIHTGEKQYECTVCQKGFSQKVHLKSHMLSHTGEKPYKCSVCKKAFTRKNLMDNHMLSHTGEKPHKCPVCDKAFTWMTSMRHHMIIHTGKKPYECRVCRKKFSQKVHMKSHMLTHTGEKPFKCRVCKKAFTRKDVMEQHMVTHTGEKSYKCSVCEKAFSRRDRMKAHMVVHAEEKPFCGGAIKVEPLT